jgi:UDP-N-acetylglucosamine:LPS N-acetylglucosamine transferase
MKILILASCGIGGTEKAATIYAVELKNRGHQVVFSGDRGPRSAVLERDGIEILPKAISVEQMVNLLERVHADVIHQHVPGYRTDNHIYEALKRVAWKPKLVQTNVFGWLADPQALDTVDYHLFISKASGAQAFRRAGLKLDDAWLGKCSVVMYPLPQENAFDPGFRSQFRNFHNISDSTLLAIRVGQPGLGKWTNWEAQASCKAADLGADVHLVLMQPSDELLPSLRPAINRGLVTILPATSDFDYLANLYSSADIMLHASSYGESFGYTIAEGMAAGLPVICRSTPWGDSAQVELVENGHTGWVCATVSEMGRRVADLAADRLQLAKMGAASKLRINAISNLASEIDLLEEVIFHVVHRTEARRIGLRNQDFLEFYHQLSARESSFSERPLPLDERVEWSIYRCYRTLRARVHTALRDW